MEYISKISGSTDRKGSITAILSQMGANFKVQQFEDAENIIVSFNPSNKRLVIGAHWDAEEGSTGANDNASGCSVLLHIIETVLAEPNFYKSVDFVFFGAEENGCVGSSDYIESVGKESIAAMVNLDVCGFGNQILLSDKGNLSNPSFYGLMDEALLQKYDVQLPGFLPQGDDCTFDLNEIPNVSICTADSDAASVFAEIGYKIASEQTITEQDNEAFLSLDVVKTLHGGELDNISYLTGESVKMVVAFLSEGLLNGTKK